MIVGLADVELHPGIAQTEVSQHVDQYGIGEGDGRGEADEAADVPLLALDLAGRLLDFGQRRAQALVIAQPSSVRRSLRVDLCSKAHPSCSSSCEMRRLMVPVGMPSAAAAWEKPPSCTTLTNR